MTATTHLTAGQRALMEAALVQRKHALEAQIEQQLGGRSRSEHAQDVLQQDFDDAPARDGDREVDLARTDQEMSELREVNAALARLGTPEFGLCAECAAAIPFDRLSHHPQVLRCVSCQSAFERQHNTATSRPQL
jgi:DnaK suppressor protein